MPRLDEGLRRRGTPLYEPPAGIAREYWEWRRKQREGDSDLLDPTGAGGYTLTFAQTEAGERLAAALGLETERVAGRERLKLEDTLHSLAMELLPPGDVETAMRQVRRGELVKSKLAFQAVLQNLADAAEHEERRRDIALAEETRSVPSERLARGLPLT